MDKKSIAEIEDFATVSSNVRLLGYDSEGKKTGFALPAAGAMRTMAAMPARARLTVTMAPRMPMGTGARSSTFLME